MPCLQLPASLKNVASSIETKMPAALKNPLILVVLCGVGALCALLVLIGFSAQWEGEMCVQGTCQKVTPSDDATVGGFSFGENDSDGSGAAAFAFVCQLFVLGLVIAALVLSLPMPFKSYSCVFYLLSASWLLVLISFCYFAEHTVKQAFSSSVTYEITYKPGMTWGWALNIVAVFVYIPAILLALSAEGAAEVKDATPTGVAAPGV